MKPETLLQTLSEKLANYAPKSKLQALVGFDGYVDKIQKVVQAKQATGNDYFDSIGGLAGLIGTLAGKSGQIELVTHETKIGGNAPILANAVAALGVPNWCYGTLSDPVFEGMHPTCERVSLGPPAETNALEFGDGKVILSEVSVFERLRWSAVVEQVGLDTLRQQFESSQLVAFVDWANLPHGNELWRSFLTEVVAPGGPKSGSASRLFFFDLCDPTKRSPHDINEALSVVAGYAPFGSVILGMNENEARRIYLAIQGHSPADTVLLSETPDLLRIALFIREQTGIPTVMIHPTDRCLVASESGVQEWPGRLVPQPKVLTGGGDNLNAGFCWALLNGFDTDEAMMLGMATSGAYIQNGQSPTVQELQEYLALWRGELVS